MKAITVAESVYVDGRWVDAHWEVQAMDGGSGELLITAATPDLAVVLRIDMETAKALRRMAGFGAESEAGWYDCRTNGERLAVQEDLLQILLGTMRRIVADIDQRLDALEAAAAPAIANREWMTEIERRLAALEQRLQEIEDQAEEEQAPMAEDKTLLSVDMMAVYDWIAMRERAQAAGGA